jgi:hypothetical protein
VKRWTLLLLVSFGCTAALASAEVGIGCKRLQLSLDPPLTPAIVESDWLSGKEHSESPAVLELRGCNGEVLDRLTLQGPLAKLDPKPLRGTLAPTYLVSADLTAEAGSYNGPLTIPVQVIRDHLVPAVARTAKGDTTPIHLALTLKAAWKKVRVNGHDDLLSVSCQPGNQGFITSYRRYSPTSKGWQVRVRMQPGLWESDGPFPPTSRFP